MRVQDRKDGWTQEDDNILTSAVLEHIRNGSTQLKAFDEAGEKLGRTPAACGFRWNSEVRKRYEDEIMKAKRERINGRNKPLKNRLSLSRLAEKEIAKNHPLFAAIEVINQYIDDEKEKREHKQTNDSIIDELSSMLQEKDQEIESLRKQLEQAREAEYAVTEDYKSLLRILKRARDMGVLTGSSVDIDKTVNENEKIG